MPHPRRTAHTTQPVSLPASYEHAFEAFLAGENQTVLAILDRTKTPSRSRVDVELLRARTYLRLRDDATCTIVLERLKNDRMSADQSIVRDFLLATSRFRSGARSASLVELENIVNDARSKSVDRAVRAEAAYFHALALWSEQQLDDALVVAEGALSDAVDVVEARMLELLGWIEVSREQLDAAGNWFVAGIHKFAQCSRRDVGVHASLVHGIAILAAETLNEDLAKVLRAEAPSVIWALGDRWRQTQVAICLGRLAELAGEHDIACDYFEDAHRTSPDTFYASFALIARANLLTRIGETFTAGRLLKDVSRMFESVAWSDTNAEQRVALLTYVFAIAERDPTNASKALIKARSIFQRDDPLMTVARDNRLAAYFLQASGAVRIARGDREDGVRDLRAAFEIWERFRYVIRAAIVAFLLWELTRDEIYRTYIDAVARTVPNSWIAKRSGLAASRVLAKLFPAELRVLEGLCNGKTENEIAHDLGRSINTVRNQRSAILRKFGVRSKAELLVKCRRLDVPVPSAGAGKGRRASSSRGRRRHIS